MESQENSTDFSLGFHTVNLTGFLDSLESYAKHGIFLTQKKNMDNGD